MFDKLKYEKLTNYCAYSERSKKDVRQKCRKLEILKEDVQEYINQLEANGLLDENRYAKTFVRSKAQRKWGPTKIRMALRMKGIADEIVQPIIDDIEGELLIEKIRELIVQKSRTIKGETAFDRKQKLTRFLLGRGYSMDLIKKAYA